MKENFYLAIVTVNSKFVSQNSLKDIVITVLPGIDVSQLVRQWDIKDFLSMILKFLHYRYSMMNNSKKYQPQRDKYGCQILWIFHGVELHRQEEQLIKSGYWL